MHISLIIPSYNRQNQLLRCLKSAEKASVPGMEVIVVDDGSYPKLNIEGFPSLDLHIIRQARLGPAAARNAGAKLARGDILFFLDDDCTLFEDSLYVCLEILRDIKIDVVGADIIGLPDDNLLARIKNRRSKFKLAQGDIAPVKLVPTFGFAIRKDVFKNIGGFDPAFLISEDDDISIRLANKGVIIWRSLKMRVTHHVKFRRLSDFYKKAKLWASEDEDILILKHHNISFVRSLESLCINLRLKFLQKPKFIYLLFISFICFLGIFYTTLRQIIDNLKNKNKEIVKYVFCDFIWNCGVCFGLLGRYWSGRLIKFGFISNFFMYNILYHLKKKPIRLILFVTNRCQADCKHCFYYERLNRPTNELSLEDYQHISSSLGKLDVLNITGGEPFLRYDIVELAQIFYRRNNVRKIIIPTNGYKTADIKDAVKEIFRRCPNLYLTLNVSLDGVANTHDEIRRLRGSYQKAIDTLQELYKIRSANPKLQVNINTTLMPDNYNQYESFLKHIRLAHPLADSIYAGMVYRRLEGGMSKNRCDIIPITQGNRKKFLHWFGGSKKIFSPNPIKLISRSLESLHDEALYLLCEQVQLTGKQVIKCKAADTFLVVDETGNVAFCEELASIGNVKDSNLKEIMISQKAKEQSALIAERKCACSHCIFQAVNLRIKPWDRKTISLYWRAFVSLLKNKFL